MSKKSKHFRKWLTDPENADSYVHASDESWSNNKQSEFKLADCQRSIILTLNGKEGLKKIKIIREALDFAEAILTNKETK